MVTSNVNSSVLARLIVEMGSPYEKGFSFALADERIVLGRATNSFKPGISFESLLISRKHCCIKQVAGQFMIAEVGSKHGTLLNGRPLVPNVFCPLAPGDQIALASGVVLLRFLLAPDFETTIDFENTQKMRSAQPKAAVARPLIVDPARRTLHIHDQEICLSGKEWRLVEVLYKHQNEIVTYEMMRSVVWAERYVLEDGIPDVGFDEVNALIYRLRRKLGVYADLLKTRRGQGCILELQ